jgi:hypothetical protein
MLVVPGASTDNGAIALAGSPPSGISGNSPANTTALYVSLTLNAGLASPAGATFGLDYKRSADATWIEAVASVTVLAPQNGSTTREVEIKAGLPGDVYQVRVRVVSYSSYASLSATWRSVAEEVIYNGTIAYVATA